jgi:hypothetical protein
MKTAIALKTRLPYFEKGNLVKIEKLNNRVVRVYTENGNCLTIKNYIREVVE